MYNKHKLTLPLKDKNILNSIKLGDIVTLNGIIVTSRDMAHKYYVETKNDETIKNLKKYLKKGAIYHCGPIVNLEKYTIISAGPTTSIREEPYQKEVIKMFDLSFVIGKGGMKDKTLGALKKYKSIYLNAIGGAGSFYAKNLKIIDVFKLKEFGMPEAIWVLEATDLFTIATMDFRGDSVYDQISQNSNRKLQDIFS